MSCEGADARCRADTGLGGRGAEHESMLCPIILVACILPSDAYSVHVCKSPVCCEVVLPGSHLVYKFQKAVIIRFEEGKIYLNLSNSKYVAVLIQVAGTMVMMPGNPIWYWQIYLYTFSNIMSVT